MSDSSDSETTWSWWVIAAGALTAVVGAIIMTWGLLTSNGLAIAGVAVFFVILALLVLRNRFAADDAVGEEPVSAEDGPAPVNAVGEEPVSAEDDPVA